MRFLLVGWIVLAMGLAMSALAEPPSNILAPRSGTVTSTPAPQRGRPTSLPQDMVNTSSPLTEGECTRLGGTVQTGGAAVVCNSGKVCLTVDQNKQEHLVCVSKQ